MNGRIRRLAGLFLAAPLLFGAVVYAQTTGNLLGKVVGPEGEALPGVTISLTGDNLIQARNIISGIEGDYRFPNIPPGRYEISFSLAGFDRVVRKDVVVALGGNTRVGVTMQLETAATEIVVTADSPVVDVKSANVGTNFDKALIENAVNSNDLWGLLQQTPSLVGDALDVGGSEKGQQISFSARGSGRGQNQYNKDGVNITDPAATGASNLYYDYGSFEEVEVSTGNHSAEVGSAGVVVNLVSKSGGNKFSGQGNFYYQDQEFVSDNRSSELSDGSAANGEVPASALDYASDLNLNLGGYAVRDKLWFFANGSRYKKSKLATGAPSNPLDLASAIESYADDVELNNFGGKLTLGINESNTALVTFDSSEKFRNSRPQFGAQLVEAHWEQQAGDFPYTWVLQGQYTTTLSQNSFLEAKIGYVDSSFNFIAKQGEDVAGGQELATGIWHTNAATSQFNARTRFQVDLSYSHYLDQMLGGNHDLKFGFQYSDADSQRRFFVPGGAILYTYYGAGTFATFYTDRTGKQQVGNISLYAQDSWTIADKLTLNLGLRYDRWTGSVPEQSGEATLYDGVEIFPGPAVEQLSDIFVWNNVAPRLSAVYDVAGDGKTAVKGGFARYYHQATTDAQSAANPNGIGFDFGLWNDNGDGVLSIDEFTSLQRRVPSDTADVDASVDPNLSSPYSDEFTLGVDREVVENVLAGATFVYRKQQNLLDDIDTGVYDLNGGLTSAFEPVSVTDPGPDGVLGTGDDGDQFTVYSQVDSVGGNFFVANPADYGYDYEADYMGVEMKVQKRFSNRWQALAAWTISKAESDGASTTAGDFAGALFDGANDFVNGRGRSAWDRPHNLKLSGSWLAPLDIKLAGTLQVYSGQAYSRTARLGCEDLGFDSDCNKADGTVGSLNAPITVAAEPNGDSRLPTLSVLDFRLGKEFDLQRYGRIGAYFDAFNLLNSGTEDNVTTLSGQNFNRIRSIIPGRILRFGVKYSF